MSSKKWKREPTTKSGESGLERLLKNLRFSLSRVQSVKRPDLGEIIRGYSPMHKIRGATMAIHGALYGALHNVYELHAPKPMRYRSSNNVLTMMIEGALVLSLLGCTSAQVPGNDSIPPYVENSPIELTSSPTETVVPPVEPVVPPVGTVEVPVVADPVVPPVEPVVPPVGTVESYLNGLCYPDSSGHKTCGYLAFILPKDPSTEIVQSITEIFFDGNAQLYVNLSTAFSEYTGTNTTGPEQLELAKAEIAGTVCLPEAEGTTRVVLPAKQGGNVCGAYAIYLPGGPEFVDFVKTNYGNIANIFLRDLGYAALPEALQNALEIAIDATISEVPYAVQEPTPPLAVSGMQLFLVPGEAPEDYSGVFANGQAQGVIPQGDYADAYTGLLAIIQNQNPYLYVDDERCFVGGSKLTSQVRCDGDTTPSYWLYAATGPLPGVGGENLGDLSDFYDATEADALAKEHELNLDFK